MWLLNNLGILVERIRRIVIRFSCFFIYCQCVSDRVGRELLRVNMDQSVSCINAVGACCLGIGIGQFLCTVMLAQYAEILLAFHVVRNNDLEYFRSLTDILGNCRCTVSHFLDHVNIDKVELRKGIRASKGLLDQSDGELGILLRLGSGSGKLNIKLSFNSHRNGNGLAVFLAVSSFFLKIADYDRGCSGNDHEY